jgi:hypothetical protein
MRIIAISVGPIALHIPMDRVDEIISALNGAQHFVWEFDNHPDNVPDRRAGDAVGSEAAIKSAEDEFAQINAAQDASYNPAEINPVAHEQVK